VERSDTHRLLAAKMMGIASLHPSYVDMPVDSRFELRQANALVCPLRDDRLHDWFCVGRCTPCLRNAGARRIIAA
jgi:hypothetical protein